MAKTTTPEPTQPTTISMAQAIREYLAAHPGAKNNQIIESLKKQGVSVDPGYVSQVRGKAKKLNRTAGTTSKKSARKNRSGTAITTPKYPRHSISKAMRIPRAILDQNAGHDCTDKQAASFVGVGLAGPLHVEISSGIKYGLLERPTTGHLKLSELARKILRPQSPTEELDGLRETVMKAPEISKVYNHYRGENLPDKKFFENALTEKFGIPTDKLEEFTSIFQETLTDAKLLDRHNNKVRILDISDAGMGSEAADERIKRLGRDIKAVASDRCFVMMPYAPPHGDYYSKVYEPAIEKAGLTAVRADADLFGTGKIMDQIWAGINSAKVLVAELTTRNQNVYYELGLAHALEKPVVLISSNEEDVPFDLQHIRVIYYDVMDPFWGQKLLDKVAENILSAIKNPEEAIFKSAIADQE